MAVGVSVLSIYYVDARSFTLNISPRLSDASGWLVNIYFLENTIIIGASPTIGDQQ